MCSFSQILNATQIASLTIIAGGTLTLGALVAPQIFNNSNRSEAGKLMTAIFSSFDQWLKGSSILLFASKLLQLIVVDRLAFVTITGFRLDLLFSTILVLAITAISLHLVYRTSNNLLNAIRKNDKTAFEALHKESEILHRINFGLALLMLFSFA